ncbi:hypothetical protein HDR66_01285 [bacterium]|nr:hypothetical protein [bacterium]
MKTETEFHEKLKRRLRKGRKRLSPYRFVDDMDMRMAVYFAHERGDIPMTVYQLYKFMHLTGRGMDFIKSIFDDEWPTPQKQ